MWHTRYFVYSSDDYFVDLCICSEYLAPEFIFNLGVNKAVDFWALGVIVHEMIMLTTPFRPRRRDDMTSLFVNIASVKVFSVFLYQDSFILILIIESWIKPFE